MFQSYPVTIFQAAIVILLGSGLVRLAIAAPPPSTEPAPVPPSVESWRKVLDQPCDLTFQNCSLREAIEQLKERFKIPIHLDPLVMNFGVNVHEPTISLELKNTKLADALRRLLTPYNLAYALTREGLIISGEEFVIARQLRQRVRVHCSDSHFGEVLRHLAAETGANIVLDPRLKDKAQQLITLRLEDVPLESAVRLLAEVADLRVVRLTNILYITTPERAERLRADADGPVPGTPPTPSSIPAMPVVPGIGIFGGGNVFPFPGAPGGAGGIEPALPQVEPRDPAKPDKKQPESKPSPTPHPKTDK
ncbi:MAG: hypothetical protein NZ703_03850 [Gemmataceae bacterium]|nr:hypothetical protein [Gemmataceae bacterium]MCS7270196.1 hypothetical protein [Gemmataceae bacterium]MDW8242928.1 hypothetical protein [Thermogemmata sp.]